MDRNSDWNSTWTSFPRTHSMVSGVTSQGTGRVPSVTVLESVNEGVVKIKVEADIMGYILYCHYSTFTSIQQVDVSLFGR